MAFANPRNLFYIRLFAMIQIGCGLFLALVVSKYGNLSCDRIQNQCQFEGGSLLQVKIETFPISQFHGARIETETTKERSGRILSSARIRLIPNQILLIDNHWSGNKPQLIANQINDFVKDPQQQTLYVSQDERFTWTPVGIGLVLIGLLLLNRVNKNKTL
jgi:hypothetical protein